MTTTRSRALSRCSARKVIAASSVIFLFFGLGIGDAGAIAVEKGNGETTTVNSPSVTKGKGPNAEGLNPAHGPICGLLEGECARHPNHPANPGVDAGGLDSPFGNVGAWNGFFQSNDNSAICGIWASTAEIPDSEPPEAQAFACDYEAP